MFNIQLIEAEPQEKEICHYTPGEKTVWVYWRQVLRFFEDELLYFEMRFRCPIANYFEMGLLIVLHEIGHAVQDTRGKGLLEGKSYSGFGSRKDHDFNPGEIEADNFAREEMKRLRNPWRKLDDDSSVVS